MYNLPGLSQEEIENMNTPGPVISRRWGVGRGMGRVGNKQNPGPDSFTGEFYQMFKVELTPLLLKLLAKLKRKECF